MPRFRSMSTRMSAAVFILYATCFISMYGIFSNAAETESSGPINNATHHVSQYKSGRSKRSLFNEMPTELNIRIKYATGEEIDLTWYKKRDYLANKHLPVITPKGYLKPNVMNEVGEFVVYQDPEKCSAVVYFGKSQTFFGVIGMNYYITHLPYKFDNDGNYPEIVGEPYIMKREHTPVHNYPGIPDTFFLDLFNPSNHDSDEAVKRTFDSCPSPSTKRQRTKRDYDEKSIEDARIANVSTTTNIRKRRTNWKFEEYYSETLVFVPRDIVQIFKEFWREDNYVEWIVRYYILYFNAVDMIVKKLKNDNRVMLINIAKIVIDDDSAPFNFISDNEVQFAETVTQLPQYLDIHRHQYTPDSFDHVFISTSRPIKYNSVLVPGATKHDVDLYDARKDDQFYEAVPITVMGIETDYVLGAHEISRILKIDIDLWQEGLEETGQCNSIMQEGSSKCDTCLRWSEHSKEQFGVFFNEDRHRCFFLNKPRSVRPPGPSRLSSPIKQCQCFGYYSYIPNSRGQRKQIINKDDCDAPLLCQKVVGELSYEYTVQPFDGTPCGTNNHFCWSGKCIESR